MWRQLTRLVQPAISNSLPLHQHPMRFFSIFSLPQIVNNTGSFLSRQPSALLQPVINSLLPLQQPNRGMKQVGNCRRRCKDCYFVVRQERM